MKKTMKEINGMFVMNVMQVIIGMTTNSSVKHVQSITVTFVNLFTNANLVLKDFTLNMEEKAVNLSISIAPLMLKITNDKHHTVTLSYSVMNVLLIPILMKNQMNASLVQSFQIA